MGNLQAYFIAVESARTLIIDLRIDSSENFHTYLLILSKFLLQGHFYFCLPIVSQTVKSGMGLQGGDHNSRLYLSTNFSSSCKCTTISATLRLPFSTK